MHSSDIISWTVVNACVLLHTQIPPGPAPIPDPPPCPVLATTLLKLCVRKSVSERHVPQSPQDMWIKHRQCILPFAARLDTRACMKHRKENENIDNKWYKWERSYIHIIVVTLFCTKEANRHRHNGSAVLHVFYALLYELKFKMLFFLYCSLDGIARCPRNDVGSFNCSIIQLLTSCLRLRTRSALQLRIISAPVFSWCVVDAKRCSIVIVSYLSHERHWIIVGNATCFFVVVVL